MFSKRVKNLTPYTPGEQPQDKKYIKLNTNENPYPPSPSIKKILKNTRKKSKNLRLYPDPESSQLKSSIADYYNSKVDNIFVGNGSDEILSFIFYTFFDSEKGPLLFPSESYSFYPVYCNFYEIKYETILLEKDFSIDLKKILNHPNNCGLILTNPNAPTGIFIPLKKLEEFMDAYSSNKVVVIDEAYIDFGGESAIPLIQKYQNLIIVQTFSKSRSLAGLRLGFALGDKKLIEMLNRAKNSFNSYPIDRLTEQIGEYSIKDQNYLTKTTKKIINTREFFSSELNKRGWCVLPSKANFIFIKHPQISGEILYKKLKEMGILVRWFDKNSIKDFIRITIGTQSEIQQLLSALKKITGSL